jgi:hypothetical protein
VSAPATRNAPARTLAGAFVAKYRHVVDDQRRLERPTSAIQTGLDLIGLFVFAISGALMATRRDFDVVGIAVLAVITALGGGILRDLVVGDAPPPRPWISSHSTGEQVVADEQGQRTRRVTGPQ